MSASKSKSRLRVLTYNIRKQKGASGRADMLHALGSHLAHHKFDVILCQEVFHPRSHRDDYDAHLSKVLGLDMFYRANKQRRVGHHGNAVFTHLPAVHVENFDFSTNSIERRGALYVKLKLDGTFLHVLNVHLGLSHRQRVSQIKKLEHIVAKHCPPHEAMIVAGDFNDWNEKIGQMMVDDFGLVDALSELSADECRTWHARRPIFKLDRVYLRNIELIKAQRLSGHPWRDLSDHDDKWGLAKNILVCRA